MRLDPLSMSINATAALLLYFARDYQGAVDQCLRALELDVNFFAPYFVCGMAYEQMGRHGKALKALRASVDTSGRLPLFVGALGHDHAVAR